MRRVIIIVLDSLGIGEMPDADKYGDSGSNTLGNMAKAVGGLNIPNLEKLGLSKLLDFEGAKKPEKIIGAYGKMMEASIGKDSTTGHWEIAGIIIKEPFKIYPDGFPEDLISEFEKRTGRKVIGNKPASGTEIIKELGPEHEKTGALIVYTSADSVFQIAAKEDIIPVEELYRYCEIARQLLNEKGHKVARVIARPFTGEWPNYVRTARRKDFSLEPDEETLLDRLVSSGIPVHAIGKIYDLYAGKSITTHLKTTDNADGIEKTIEALKRKKERCLIFTNLVDFDMKYGHRNDPYGYAKALEYFDKKLKTIMENMFPEDILFITADHGCDPVTPSTDHSREIVPVLIYGNDIKEDVYIGIRRTFADLGQTVADIFEVGPLKNGESFKKLIMK